jgi:hypothetical protein
MNYMMFVYKWTARELRKIILATLKSWVADEIKRFNYVQSYSVKEKNIEKTEEKILLIHTKEEDKLLDFLSNFQQIEKININFIQ